MANLNGFDATQHEDMQSFEAIPKGEYLAMAVESEMKETNAGTGHYLQITLEILDGPHKGRKLWSRLNLDNPNQTAVDIAKRELSSICKAVGVLRPKDSSELHGVPIKIKVGVEKRKDTGELTNRVTGYAPANGGGTSKPKPEPAAEEKPPWA